METMDIKLNNSAALGMSVTNVGDTPCFKVVLCGDYGVGKTSLFRRFVYDDFWPEDDDAAKSSVLGMDFSTREFDVGDECSVKLWDTAGIERYATLSPNYYKQSSAIVICYATDDRMSLTTVANHVTVAASHSACVPPPLYFLCGCRADCTSSNRVVTEDVDRLTGQVPVNVAACYTVSAATGLNVDEMFLDLARRLADVQKTAAVTAVTVVTDSLRLRTCCSHS